jgi:hypothetical protein
MICEWSLCRERWMVQSTRSTRIANHASRGFTVGLHGDIETFEYQKGGHGTRLGFSLMCVSPAGFLVSLALVSWSFITFLGLLGDSNLQMTRIFQAINWHARQKKPMEANPASRSWRSISGIVIVWQELFLPPYHDSNEDGSEGYLRGKRSSKYDS